MSLKYISEEAHNELFNQIESNLTKYTNGDFSHLISKHGYNLEIKDIKVNLNLLKNLDSSSNLSNLDIDNSMIVWEALNALTPSMATEKRIWTRLTHIETFEFTRKRWLSNIGNDNKTINDIKNHFFSEASTITRDHNSISRLWWNAWIANQINPNDPRSILETILKKADIRTGFIERPYIATRKKLSYCLVQKLKSNNFKQNDIRAIFKAVNLYGSGIVFETLDNKKINLFLDRCISIAQKNSI